jgi:hypothetical protein
MPIAIKKLMPPSKKAKTNRRKRQEHEKKLSKKEGNPCGVSPKFMRSAKKMLHLVLHQQLSRN